MGWDETTFELLYKEHHPGLVQFAYYKIKSLEDAQEIVQEVFLNVWLKRDSLDIDESLKFYLYKATKNRCINYLQRNKLQFYDDIEEGHAVMMPADELQALELEAIITHAINCLPHKRREIFLLSRREQLSHKQIAEVLDISYKTVENQIGLALKSIKELLSKMGH